MTKTVSADASADVGAGLAGARLRAGFVTVSRFTYAVAREQAQETSAQ
jgi:hypothetical protein